MIIVDNLEYLSSYYSCSSRRLHPHRSIYVSLLSYSLSLVVRIIVDTVDLTHTHTSSHFQISCVPVCLACPGLGRCCIPGRLLLATESIKLFTYILIF